MKTNASLQCEPTERESAHRKLACTVAEESIVLLHNDGVLPLKPCPVALFGSGAATTIKGGTGSGEVNERYSITIEQGLTNAGFTITTTKWLRDYEILLKKEKAQAYTKMAKRILNFDANARINMMATDFQYPPGRPINSFDMGRGAEALTADTAIYVIARQAGECTDRSLDERGFYLSSEEIAHLEALTSFYKKLVLVINASGPLDLTPLDQIQGINALFFFCQQGMEGGTALANLITGETTPSACLSSSWPLCYDDLPYAREYSYLGGEKATEEYHEGIYVGYRYYDSFDKAPRYEFGYGLSYTSFLLEPLSISLSKSVVTLTAKVTNTGNIYQGKKCVQLYVSAPGTILPREYQSLAAFAKTTVLAPGASEVVTLEFDLVSLAAYDHGQASFLLEQGKYILRLGESSRKTQVVTVLELDKTVVTEVCTNVCRLEHPLEEIAPQAPRLLPISAQAESLYLSAADIPTMAHDYQLPEPVLSPRVEELRGTLSQQEQLTLLVATGEMDNKPSFCVPGAAAYTTSDLLPKGIPPAVLCDGPAGVRVTKTSVKQKNGKIKPLETPMEFMDYVPWYIKKYLLGNPKRGTLLYQHATAFPVGTALAQTWNTTLVEQVGKAMGCELSEFGATFLLAPGMNIQRNPLCGRNYEYYSEDPLFTGKLAAALTRGVQSLPGCYVTLKHYAANSQEYRRNYSDSVIGERALREIYLKAFRIAVREGGAKAVMTSYNKLNGVYTSNSYDLCTNLLRCEWGFEGVVMSDWFATGKGIADNSAAIAAGNDLICPGGKWYLGELELGLAAGSLSESDVRRSCSRLLQAVFNGRTGTAADLT